MVKIKESGIISLGVFLLAVSITFSITLMNVSAGLLLVALLIRIFRKEINYKPTGLEIPLLLFLAFYLLSALLSGSPMRSMKGVADNYWYVLYMYLVIYLFGEKEIEKFSKILCIAAVIMSIYAIVQSFTGFRLLGGLNLSIGSNEIKMGTKHVEKAAELFKFPIYMGTGMLGHHLTFGGQILMLTFFSAAYFRKKWPVMIILIALVISFAYSAWLGFVFGLVFYLLSGGRKVLYATIIASLIFVFLIIPGNISKTKAKLSGRMNIWKVAMDMFESSPVFGIGTGQYTPVFKKKYSDNFPGTTEGARCHTHSIYLGILTGGGIFTFLSFVYFLIRFVLVYSKPPPGKIWKDLHYGALTALAAVFAAGIFQTYLTDAENSVLIWTFMGLIIKMRQLSEHTSDPAAE